MDSTDITDLEHQRSQAAVAAQLIAELREEIAVRLDFIRSVKPEERSGPAGTIAAMSASYVEQAQATVDNFEDLARMLAAKVPSCRAAAEELRDEQARARLLAVADDFQAFADLILKK